MAVPDARAAATGLVPADSRAGFNTAIYSRVWNGTAPSEELDEWLKNTSKWNWGATDPDLCCSDGAAPSFILNTLSRQGAPSGFHGESNNFARLGVANMTLWQWLRSYFPESEV